MDFEKVRRKMVDEQIIGRGIHDKKVIKAMHTIPRHLFVLKQDQDLAYQDFPVSIGEGQTISQPLMVALMTQALSLRGDEAVLEIGTGSGYQTAVLAELSDQVYTIECIEPLSLRAQKILKELKFMNIHFYIGDGSEGIKNHQEPFDAIIMTAAAPRKILKMFDLLKEGGRLLMPIGERQTQTLTLFTKHNARIKEEKICQCVFVPLIGKYGFDKS